MQKYGNIRNGSTCPECCGSGAVLRVNPIYTCVDLVRCDFYYRRTEQFSLGVLVEALRCVEGRVRVYDASKDEK